MTRSLNEEDGGAPEVGFAGGGVEDGYLAVVLAGWEAVDTERESQRHSAEAAGWIGDDGGGWCVQDLVVALIEGDVGEEGLRGGLGIC